MAEEALNRSVHGSEGGNVRSARGPKTSVAKRPKEEVLRAVSESDALRGKAEPDICVDVVSRLFDHQVKDQSLPSSVARFLDTHWRSYMMRLCAQEGEASETWQNALKNTENLTWSLRPKCDDESRRRLYDILPELFYWVHAVLKSQRVAVPEEDAFFTELAELQVRALHSDAHSVAGFAPGSARTTDAGDKLPAQRYDGGSRISADAGPKSLQQEIRQVPKSGKIDADAPDDLAVGAAVEFQSDRATKRVLRLEWISRGGGVYQFRDLKRGDAICLTAERCYQCLREGSARVLS